MSAFEWSFLGALLFAIIIFCARLMRRGLTTFDDHRKEYISKIKATELQLQEDNKNIPSQDHLYIMRTALEDLIRLECCNKNESMQNFEVTEEASKLFFKTPRGVLTVQLHMRERSLKTTGRVLHGKSRWTLTGFGYSRNYSEPATLMSDLNMWLHYDKNDLFTPPYRPYVGNIYENTEKAEKANFEINEKTSQNKTKSITVKQKDSSKNIDNKDSLTIPTQDIQFDPLTELLSLITSKIDSENSAKKI